MKKKAAWAKHQGEKPTTVPAEEVTEIRYPETSEVFGHSDGIPGLCLSLIADVLRYGDKETRDGVAARIEAFVEKQVQS